VIPKNNSSSKLKFSYNFDNGCHYRNVPIVLFIFSVLVALLPAHGKQDEIRILPCRKALNEMAFK
jgi:hypothetical protein